MATPTEAQTPVASSAASSLSELQHYDDPIAVEKAPTLPAQQPSSVRPIHGWRWFSSAVAIYATAFLYGLDTTIAADVQPAVVKSLGGIEKLAWVGVGFPLGSVATILPIGHAYSLFEIKYFYLAFVVLFEMGSLLCGVAPTMDVLIVGRVVAGAGGAGMYLGVLNYLSTFTTLRERPMYVALTGLVWGIGTVLGPVIGGGFAVSNATWRWRYVSRYSRYWCF